MYEWLFGKSEGIVIVMVAIFIIVIIRVINMPVREANRQIREANKQKAEAARQAEIRKANALQAALQGPNGNRIRELQQEKRQLQAELDKTTNDLETVVKGTYALQQKEKDWAVHGGIASGIAGPIAGIATAMNVQNENAQIRAYNEQVRKLTQPAFHNVMDRRGKLLGRISDIDREIESLVANSSNNSNYTSQPKLDTINTPVSAVPAPSSYAYHNVSKCPHCGSTSFTMQYGKLTCSKCHKEITD